MSFYLDKSSWRRVAFGDVARNVNVTVRNASLTGIDRVIAMEHIDPGELKIRRWGSVDDGTTFARRVKPGQTLFGKRRAYQRKVAHAEFEAICSGDILTLEADETQLRPDLLPFIVQSNSFFNHALGTSAGSLSPRTNWRDLAAFGFTLPAPDDQERIANLLWAIEHKHEALSASLDAIRSMGASFVAKALGSTDANIVTLETLIRSGTTITYGIVQAGAEVENGVPYIRVTDMTAGTLALEGMKRTAPEVAAKFTRSRVEEGDLVVALRGRTGLTLAVPAELDGANLTQGTARVAVDAERVDAAYVAAVMNSSWMAAKINRQAKGSTFTELTLASLRNLPIPRLGGEVEVRFVRDLLSLSRASTCIEEELVSLRTLRSAILTQVFGGH